MPMPTILYPTRGGRSSYPNQERVFALARERQADLLLLYVTNVEFLGLVARAKVVDLEEQLDNMGEFLLAMAQERAEQAGVRAETLVRRGEFRQVLGEVVAEYAVDTVVLGAPSEKTGLTTLDFMRTLCAELSAETGVPFLLVQDGEIVETFIPSPPEQADD
ncbi:MAG TPA: universal stress protein [Chloroflexi bacterium]|nr:universal stress protein [Chloroflexota bacterium]